MENNTRIYFSERPFQIAASFFNDCRDKLRPKQRTEKLNYGLNCKKTRWKMRKPMTFSLFSILIGMFTLLDDASHFDNKSNENDSYFVVHEYA